ncbi:MAG: hypothetical protein M1530_03885 [Candidatus Marsarchaeota archaeon]|nr:hypothetical protein [Candidatus Marsarchaeota archaeon]
MRGQSSVEYLVILAIVLVAVMLGATLLGGLVSGGSPVGGTETTMYWNSGAKPFGILQWGQANDTLYMSVVNHGQNYLFLREIHVGNVTADLGPGWAWRGGSAKNVSIPGLPPCSAGGYGSFFYNVTFVYDTVDIPGQSQRGEKMVSGYCAF